MQLDNSMNFAVKVKSPQDWIWGGLEREGSRMCPGILDLRMELVVPQMGNTGAGACLQENQEYSLDLSDERWTPRWRCGGIVGYLSLGWRGECWAGEIHLGVSIFMIFKLLNLDELPKGMSVARRWRRGEVQGLSSGTVCL